MTATNQTLRKQPNKEKRHATALRDHVNDRAFVRVLRRRPDNPPDTVSNRCISGIIPIASELFTAWRPKGQSDGRVRSVVVYTSSNGAYRNEVVSFVSRGGALRYGRSFDTGGLGDPSVAGTVQGSMATSADNRFLFVVDAGSNEITSFASNRAACSSSAGSPLAVRNRLA